ncbi:hypothetical protein F4810DRAFT_147291 [Camillea tinctor]|nr:hypothetical protein F4810DRAFT_147291 [Camillea tinctor]
MTKTRTKIMRTPRTCKGKMGHPRSIQSFACPFYKRYPMKHRRCSRCVLSKISYVKQHLVRWHSAGIYCARCYHTFSNNDELEEHIRQPKSCKIKALKQMNGMTTSQRELLSHRASQSQEADEQWFEIWNILFPGEKRPASVYTDLGLPEEVNLFMDYVIDNLPREIESHLQDSPSQQKDGVEDFVKQSLSRLAETWKKDWRNGALPQESEVNG